MIYPYSVCNDNEKVLISQRRNEINESFSPAAPGGGLRPQRRPAVAPAACGCGGGLRPRRRAFRIHRQTDRQTKLGKYSDVLLKVNAFQNEISKCAHLRYPERAGDVRPPPVYRSLHCPRRAPRPRRTQTAGGGTRGGQKAAATQPDPLGHDGDPVALLVDGDVAEVTE